MVMLYLCCWRQYIPGDGDHRKRRFPSWTQVLPVCFPLMHLFGNCENRILAMGLLQQCSFCSWTKALSWNWIWKKWALLFFCKGGAMNFILSTLQNMTFRPLQTLFERSYTIDHSRNAIHLRYPLSGLIGLLKHHKTYFQCFLHQTSQPNIWLPEPMVCCCFLLWVSR